MKISAHLRDFHGYDLAESVQRSPSQMARLHELEHEEAACNHPADSIETKGRGV